MTQAGGLRVEERGEDIDKGERGAKRKEEEEKKETEREGKDDEMERKEEGLSGAFD